VKIGQKYNFLGVNANGLQILLRVQQGMTFLFCGLSSKA